MRTKKSQTTEPDTPVDGIEELIRLKAYGYYEQRGYEDGHEIDDWLRAETEVVGQKASESVDGGEEHEAADVAA